MRINNSEARITKPVVLNLGDTPPQQGVNNFPGGRELLRALHHAKFLHGKVSRPIYLLKVRGLKQRTTT